MTPIIVGPVPLCLRNTTNWAWLTAFANDKLGEEQIPKLLGWNKEAMLYELCNSPRQFGLPISPT